MYPETLMSDVRPQTERSVTDWGLKYKITVLYNTKRYRISINVVHLDTTLGKTLGWG